MNLVRIHQCLCDLTRLRIVHLLLGGPLCVCHLQEVLAESQVKVSRHLAYLKRHGLVQVERCANWMIYRLPDKRGPQLDAHLDCLRACATHEQVLREDAQRLDRLRSSFTPEAPSCVRQPARQPHAT